MGKEILKFGDIEIKKKKNSPLQKSYLFRKCRYCKYFIGYLYNDYKIMPLHIMLPKTRGHVKGYDGETKWMYFLIENDGLLE